MTAEEATDQVCFLLVRRMALNHTELTCVKEKVRTVDPTLEVVVSLLGAGVSICVQGPATADLSHDEMSEQRRFLLRAMRDGIDEAFTRSLDDVNGPGWGALSQELAMA